MLDEVVVVDVLEEVVVVDVLLEVDVVEVDVEVEVEDVLVDVVVLLVVVVDVEEVLVELVEDEVVVVPSSEIYMGKIRLEAWVLIVGVAVQEPGVPSVQVLISWAALDTVNQALNDPLFFLKQQTIQ